jgi:hypothetical protein
MTQTSKAKRLNHSPSFDNTVDRLHYNVQREGLFVHRLVRINMGRHDEMQ